MTSINTSFQASLFSFSSFDIQFQISTQITFFSSQRPSQKMSITVSWNNLSYEVDDEVSIIERFLPKGIKKFDTSTRRTILRPQNGHIKSGTLTAVMGPSGAGKSTLLDIITGRIEAGVGGSISVQTPSDKKRVQVSLVPQHDSLIGHFSVHETLMFASKMKNPKGTNHGAQVEDVLNALNLSDASKTRISKCSGGQLKRISIGLEIISNPDILILDEPTSGLDSMNAELVIRLLQQLANPVRSEESKNSEKMEIGGKIREKSGKMSNVSKVASKYQMAIVVTIHQPNYLVFSMFSSIYLLNSVGNLIYHGTPSAVNDHFKKFGLIIPKEASPGDFALEVATRNEYRDKNMEMANYYVNCSLINGLINARSENSGEKVENSGETEKSFKTYDPKDVINDKDADAQLMNSTDKKDVITDKDQLITRCGRDVFNISSNENVSKFEQFKLLSERSIKLSIFKSPRLLSKLILHLIVIIGISDVYRINPGLEDGCLIVKNAENLSFNEAFNLYQHQILSDKDLEQDARPLSLIDERVEEVFNGTNFQYSALMYAMLIYAIGSVLVTPLELSTVSKEMNNSWYKPIIYMMSKTLSEVPSLILSSFLAIYLIFVCTDQKSDLFRIFLYSLTFLTLSWTSESYGTLIGVVFKDVIISTLFTISSLIPSLLFAGFLVRVQNMKILYQYLSYFSLIRLSFEPALIIMYGYGRCEDIPNTFEVSKVKNVLETRNMELTTRLALNNIGLDEHSVYRYGHIIDTDRECFNSVINNFFNHFHLFQDAPNSSLNDIENVDENVDFHGNSFILQTFDLNENLLFRRIFMLFILGLTFRILTFVTILMRKKGNRE